MAWFDAGVNLPDKQIDFEALLDAAIAAGVDKLCIVTTHGGEWDEAYALYEAFPNHLVFTLGIHPHYAKDASLEDFARLETMLQHPGAVAVGECGLDFFRNFSPSDKQVDVFLAQLKLAKKHNKPLYLHERNAFDTQIKCLDSVFGQRLSSNDILGLAHCFTGTTHQMHAYLERGLYIGITGWLCDPVRGEDLRQSIATLPLNRLVLETDAPYLFPKNVRPRRRQNEPALLPSIAEYYATVSNHKLSDIEELSYTNTRELFGLL